VGGRGLDAGAGLFKPVAMGPNEVEDAAAEINLRVQIVSPPPDHTVSQHRKRPILISFRPSWKAMGAGLERRWKTPGTCRVKRPETWPTWNQGGQHGRLRGRNRDSPSTMVATNC
jgi:hypothetical protein